MIVEILSMITTSITCILLLLYLMQVILYGLCYFYDHLSVASLKKSHNSGNAFDVKFNQSIEIRLKG